MTYKIDTLVHRSYLRIYSSDFCNFFASLRNISVNFPDLNFAEISLQSVVLVEDFTEFLPEVNVFCKTFTTIADILRDFANLKGKRVGCLVARKMTPSPIES